MVHMRAIGSSSLNFSESTCCIHVVFVTSESTLRQSHAGLISRISLNWHSMGNNVVSLTVEGFVPQHLVEQLHPRAKVGSKFSLS